MKITYTPRTGSVPRRARKGYLEEYDHKKRKYDIKVKISPSQLIKLLDKKELRRKFSVPKKNNETVTRKDLILILGNTSITSLMKFSPSPEGHLFNSATECYLHLSEPCKFSLKDYKEVVEYTKTINLGVYVTN